MTSTPTVTKLKSPSDIVQVVPLLVGFHPTESLVVLCMHGARKRNGLTFRVDLPAPEHEASYTEQVVEHAERGGADAVTMVVYSQALNDESDQFPYTRLVNGILGELTRRGLGYQEVLLVRDGRWHSYDCADACCPREGTPVPQEATGEIAAAEARAALEGKAVLGSRAELEASVRGPVALRSIALQQVFERIGDEVVDRVHDGQVDDVLRETMALARAAYDRYVAGNHTLSDDEAVRILIGLEDRSARDLLFTWALDGHRQELVVLLCDLARCAPDEYAAPICTVLGSVAYQDGGGALAAIAFERALRSDPTYELAILLDGMLQQQVPPAKVRQVARETRKIMGDLGVARPDAA